MRLKVKMAEVVNLSASITEQLPKELVNFMQVAGTVAQRQSQKLYLVGGVVRDLLLKRANFDLDLVVEGDAIKLAGELTNLNQGKIVTHHRFGTAKLKWNGWSVDLATARSESYVKPGALPTVKPGATLRDDLFRRDFTINTMAIELNPHRYGQLLDRYGGGADLEQKLVRVLHDKSFLDDATRIWRGLRYEQRLDFQLEPTTLQLLKRGIAYLDTISGDRIRHELELILGEAYPEKVLRRAGELGVLAKLHPALEGNGWLIEKFEQARKLSSPDSPSAWLYLALLAYRLSDEESEQLITYLRLPKSAARTLRDTISLKTRLGPFDNPDLPPSRVYSLLGGYSLPAVTANCLATDSPIAQQRIHLFLGKLRYMKPALSGDSLKRMGVAPGPRIKEILNSLLAARLDGEITTKREEESLVKNWLAGTNR